MRFFKTDTRFGFYAIDIPKQKLAQFEGKLTLENLEVDFLRYVNVERSGVPNFKWPRGTCTKSQKSNPNQTKISQNTKAMI
jgi:hypothetical protein